MAGRWLGALWSEGRVVVVVAVMCMIQRPACAVLCVGAVFRCCLKMTLTGSADKVYNLSHPPHTNTQTL